MKNRYVLEKKQKGNFVIKDRQLNYIVVFLSKFENASLLCDVLNADERGETYGKTR